MSWEQGSPGGAQVPQLGLQHTRPVLQIALPQRTSCQSRKREKTVSSTAQSRGAARYDRAIEVVDHAAAHYEHRIEHGAPRELTQYGMSPQRERRSSAPSQLQSTRDEMLRGGLPRGAGAA